MVIQWNVVTVTLYRLVSFIDRCRNANSYICFICFNINFPLLCCCLHYFIGSVRRSGYVNSCIRFICGSWNSSILCVRGLSLATGALCRLVSFIDRCRNASGYIGYIGYICFSINVPVLCCYIPALLLPAPLSSAVIYTCTTS